MITSTRAIVLKDIYYSALALLLCIDLLLCIRQHLGTMSSFWIRGISQLLKIRRREAKA